MIERLTDEQIEKLCNFIFRPLSKEERKLLNKKEAENEG